MREALGGVPAPPADTATDTRILDATLQLVGEYGERRLTVDDVAAGSRVARATIFRRFGSKDALLQRLYQREVRTAMALVHDAMRDAPDATTSIVDGFCCLLDHTTGHPVIQRIARAEPDIMVGLWRDGETPGLAMIRALLTVLAQHGDAVIPRRDLEQLSDLLARLLFAETLLPPDARLGLASRAREAYVRQLVGAVVGRDDAVGAR
ncbi:MAG: TetR family transcriptional regulator [Solirubrobacterales bacterium]|nr:TetR family transcriptional regulator [Solirubrobacterales bacterium]